MDSALLSSASASVAAASPAFAALTDRAASLPKPLAVATTLAELPLGQPAVVTHVVAPVQAPEWAQALDDLGFVPGEGVRLLARGLPGGDPLMVRVGTSTYALRGAEARCICVRLT